MSGIIPQNNTQRPSENRLPVLQTAFYCRLRMESTAYAFDFCTYAAEFFLDVFIAAVEVVDAFDDGFAICDQTGHDEAGGGAQVGCHHDGAGEFSTPLM